MFNSLNSTQLLSVDTGPQFNIFQLQTATIWLYKRAQNLKFGPSHCRTTYIYTLSLHYIFIKLFLNTNLISFTDYITK